MIYKGIKWDNPKTENLFQAVLKLRNLGETKKFFRDLLTEDELAEFAARWQTAQMLDKKISYTTIRGKTGLSPRTIARISSWLKNGIGGYRLMLNRMHHHNSLPIGKGLR
jgi:TrpR-related protein YerC/YecD